MYKGFKKLNEENVKVSDEFLTFCLTNLESMKEELNALYRGLIQSSNQQKYNKRIRIKLPKVFDIKPFENRFKKLLMREIYEEGHLEEEHGKRYLKFDIFEVPTNFIITDILDMRWYDKQGIDKNFDSLIHILESRKEVLSIPKILDILERLVYSYKAILEKYAGFKMSNVYNPVNDENYKKEEEKALKMLSE